MQIKPISIGVITYNSENTLESCLESINCQTNLHFVSEVIIVDNGSTDSTHTQIKDSAKKAKVPYILIINTQNNIAIARQIVLKKATAKLVAFLDSDCIAPINWLEELYANYLQLTSSVINLAGVCGGNRPKPEHSVSRALGLSMSIALGHGFSPQAWLPQRVVAVGHLPTTNCLIDRAMALTAGGFNQNFAKTGEDLELGYRMTEMGYQLKLLPLPIVQNGLFTNLNEWFFRMNRFGRANAKAHLLRHKWPRVLQVTSCLFVVYLALFPFWFIKPTLMLPFLSYISILIITSLVIYGKKLLEKKEEMPIILLPLIILSFFATHIGYGTGYLTGLLFNIGSTFEKRYSHS